MSEMGEKIYTVPEQKEPEVIKRPVKVRIVLFFDGTLNNRLNIEEREKNSEIYKDHGGGGNNSYDNGRTNIAIMEKHLLEEAAGYDVCLKSYIEGQGTFDLKKDSVVGYALGGGDSGVCDRAEKGVKRAFQLILSSKKILMEEHYIQRLTIDVFGFSRGAATARYAIHLLLEGDKKYGRAPLHERLERMSYDIQKNAVEVCFAGLYDTVLSYYGSQYLKSSGNVLQQTAVSRAKKALHLAAAEEHRRDYPLHNIKSAKAKGGEEYFLPGVHSDVGGSYNMASDLELERESDESKKVYMLTTDERMVINSGDPQMVRNDREDLIAQGWYKPGEITEEVLVRNDFGVTTYAGLRVERREIRSAYSNIPLKIMADFARKPEVNLQLHPKLEKRADIILSKEDDLGGLERRIKSYVDAKTDSKPEDWLNDPSLKDIRHRHFHFSSRDSIGYFPRMVWDEKRKRHKRKRFYYDA